MTPAHPPTPSSVPHVLGTIAGHGGARPDAEAVRGLDQQLTYAELCDRAARLAAGLAARGVGEGDRVALLLPNSVDFVVAALGVMWLGAVFVPLAVGDPRVRIEAIVADCRPALVVAADAADGADAAGSPDGPGGFVGAVPVVGVAALVRAGGSPATPAGAAHRAVYIIYTSGTTGSPKGVVIAEAAFGWAVRSTAGALGLGPATRGLCVSPFHFDGSFGTLWPTLFAGGALVVRPRESLLFVRPFFTAVAEERITCTGFSPSYLRLLLAHPRMASLADSTLEVIALGGEASTPRDVRALWAAAPRTRVCNRYGPTETTIAVTHVHLTPERLAAGPVPLGVPHDGVSFHLIDDRGGVVDGPHLVGELHIGGVQLMEGYWGAPELTAEVLRPDVVPGELVYRTGDLVFRDDAGLYVYVDRADRVIKRSGVRVSLVEVGEAVGRLPGVRSATCCAFDDDGRHGIVAFVVTEGAVGDAELRSAARTVLPDAMVPDTWRRVAALPLTGSGKVDERELLADAGLRPPAAAARPGGSAGVSPS